MPLDLSIFRYVVLVAVVIILSFVAANFRGDIFSIPTFVGSLALGLMFLIWLGTLPGYLILIVAILLGIMFFTTPSDESEAIA